MIFHTLNATRIGRHDGADGEDGDRNYLQCDQHLD